MPLVVINRASVTARITVNS